MTERANELAGLCLCEGGPGLSEIVALFHQYGREVRQQALDAINNAYLPGLPETANDYQRGLRTGGNDALSMLAMDIKGRPLP